MILEPSAEQRITQRNTVITREVRALRLSIKGTKLQPISRQDILLTTKRLASVGSDVVDNR